jgi:hypothetical protein
MTDRQYPGPPATVNQGRPTGDPEPSAEERARRWRRLLRHPPVDLSLVAVLLVLATVSRRLGYLLSHSFGWMRAGWPTRSAPRSTSSGC